MIIPVGRGRSRVNTVSSSRKKRELNPTRKALDFVGIRIRTDLKNKIGDDIMRKAVMSNRKRNS